MTLLQIVVIAVVQGITEFLPISSSGHLVLVPVVTNWPDQGLLIDIAVHVGTLGAVIVYLWRDLWSMVGALGRLGAGREDPGLRLLGHLVIASVPVVVAGALVQFFARDAMRGAEVIGLTMLGFGVVLHACDRFGGTLRRIDDMGLGGAFLIGLAQAVALIPGSSRAGMTISAARILGYDRREAARFSMLLAIPAIVAAGSSAGYNLVQAGNAQVQADAMLAAALAFVAALITIYALMGWLRRATYTPFVIYRILLGAAILGWVYL